MRERTDGTCVVIDLYRSVPKPGGYSWETEPVTIASGPDWASVAEAMRSAGIEVSS